METTITIIVILFIHYVCDFIYQGPMSRVLKATSVKWLLIHTFTYTFLFGLHLLLYRMIVTMDSPNIIPQIIGVLRFMGITFVAHTLTDFISSKATKYFHRKHDNVSLMNTIGLDQWVHYVQIFISYYLVFG